MFRYFSARFCADLRSLPSSDAQGWTFRAASCIPLRILADKRNTLISQNIAITLTQREWAHPTDAPSALSTSGFTGCLWCRGIILLTTCVCIGRGDFDKGQIGMARRLGTSILETATLVGCRRATVVSIYQKWKNDDETLSRRWGVARSHRITECARRRFSRFLKQTKRLPVARLTARYKAGQSTSIPEYTVYRTLLDKQLPSRRFLQLFCVPKVDQHGIRCGHNVLADRCIGSIKSCLFYI